MLKLINKNKLIWYGRNLEIDGIRYFNYSSSGFEFCFTGKKAIAEIESDSDNWNEKTYGVLAVYVKEISKNQFKGNSFWEVDEKNYIKKEILSLKNNKIILFDSSELKTVIVKVLKISEAGFGYAGLKNLFIDGKIIKPKNGINNKKIEFIGDSITCGYGIEGIYEKDEFDTKQERSDKSYAYLTAKKFNAEFHCISWSGIGIISKYVDETIDNPCNEITMPLLWPYTDKFLCSRLGKEIIEWSEKNFSPDLIIINLGTNDNSFIRNYENRKMIFVNSLRVFIETVHRRSPKAKICCCYGMMGQELFSAIEEAVNFIKKDFPLIQIRAVKLPLQNQEEDGVGTDWHPSSKTHQKAAEFLYEKLKDFI